jgi:DNA-binding NarL/FixJ family response regulator
MNVLVVTSSNFNLERIVDLLIPNGVAVYQFEHRSEMVTGIMKNAIDCMLIDFTAESGEESIRLIREIVQSPHDEVRRVAVVLYVGSEGANKELLSRAMDEGAISFIRSNATTDVLIKHIAACCEKVQGSAPSIRYALVKLIRERPAQNVPVKFHSPVTGQAILGTVIELSAGGMEIEVLGKYDIENLTVKMVMKDIEFNLLEHKLEVDGVIVARDQARLTILFINMSDSDRHELSQFIFMKLSGLI